MAQFGDLLAELRADKKMTQKQLAQIIFVSPGTISNYEKNVYLPDVEKLLILADFFHVSTDYILGKTPINLPPDIFQQNFTEDKTIGEVIKLMQHLNTDRRKTLLAIMKDMDISLLVDQLGKRGLL